MKKIITFISFMLLLPIFTYAWQDHLLLSSPAFSVMPEVSDAEKIKVEKLEDFLTKEAPGLAALLAEDEAWLVKNVPEYPSLPAGIMFKGGDAKNIRLNFLKAMRLNPDIKLGYYLQDLPGYAPSKRPVPPKNITVFKKIDNLSRYSFRSINPGQLVSVIDVLSTASDEPDYGNDVGLYSDSNTEVGKIYGLGDLPFGDPRLEYATQAPFHMGFYHQSLIIYKLAPYLKKTYPEYRIHQYSSLARYAFKTGHPYWGWRFLGWGLHYIQDLTQPYHTKVVPGSGTLRMIWINLSKARTDESVRILSDRHKALENYFFETMVRLYLDKKTGDQFFQALRSADADGSFGDFTEAQVRSIITKNSFQRADDLDESIAEWGDVMKFVEDNFHIENFNNGKGGKNLDSLLAELMKNLGAHSRNYVRSIIKK